MPRQIMLTMPSPTPDIDMLMRNPVFIFTNLLAIVTGLMGFLLTSASAAFQHSFPYATSTMAQGDIQPVTDLFIFGWCFGGSLIGAYIGIVQAVLAVDAKNKGQTVPIPANGTSQRTAKIVMAFSVSLLVGILISPAIVASDWVPDQWQYMFPIGGLVSYGAWAILYIVNKIYGHFMKRADKEGLAGVVDEARKTIHS